MRLFKDEPKWTPLGRSVELDGANAVRQAYVRSLGAYAGGQLPSADINTGVAVRGQQEQQIREKDAVPATPAVATVSAMLAAAAGAVS
jgi:hypothetical protein